LNSLVGTLASCGGGGGGSDGPEQGYEVDTGWLPRLVKEHAMTKEEKVKRKLDMRSGGRF
jgi:hypothetical protein